MSQVTPNSLAVQAMPRREGPVREKADGERGEKAVGSRKSENQQMTNKN